MRETEKRRKMRRGWRRRGRGREGPRSAAGTKPSKAEQGERKKKQQTF